MKKILIFIALLAFVSFNADAQFGNLLKKAGEKAAEKATKAVKDRLNGDQEQTQNNNTPNSSESNTSNSTSNDDDHIPTLPEILAQMPTLPTAAQLADYKQAEANEKTLKMMTSPVTRFRSEVVTLAAQALASAYSNLDSNYATLAAQRYTGLTEAEMKALENMSEEEQEAYLNNYYQSGRADEARMQAAQRVAEYAQLIEPDVKRYEAIDDKIQKIYQDSHQQMVPIYQKYADRINNAEGKDQALLLAEYYSKIVNLNRSAVEQAMQLRIKEQMPIAEAIEKTNEGLRKKDPGALIPNYLQIFATAYFAEVENLFSVPTSFSDED